MASVKVWALAALCLASVASGPIATAEASLASGNAYEQAIPIAGLTFECDGHPADLIEQILCSVQF